jgi:hypothetical protein
MAGLIFPSFPSPGFSGFTKPAIHARDEVFRKVRLYMAFVFKVIQIG